MAATELNHPLIHELEAYENMRASLEEEHWGKWVIISSGELVGACDFYDEANTEAINLGLDPLNCCIRQVGAEPHVILSYGRLDVA